jgi:anaerobic selenocysteine-containing dehydrogenase
LSKADLCGWGRSFATRYTYGVGSVGSGGGGGAMPDIENTGVLILWGYTRAILDSLMRPPPSLH